eukprot:COSAG01_NODE_39086_length_481_cov_0.937173_1_plen_52_part_10
MLRLAVVLWQPLPMKSGQLASRVAVVLGVPVPVPYCYTVPYLHILVLDLVVA